MSTHAKHSPQVGFNSNVRYRGNTFHIQTEDSGRERPRVTTLLFVDGGHIIASRRCDYQQLLTEPDFAVKLKQQMQEQHRSVLRELASGVLDDKIESVLGPLPPRSSGRGDGANVGLRLGKGSMVDPLLSMVGEQSLAEPLSRPSTGAPSNRSNPGAPSEAVDVLPSSRGVAAPVVNRAPDEADRKVPGLPRRISGRPAPAAASGPRPSVAFEPSSTSLLGAPELAEGSLNDVILSFIAQELEGPPKKG